MNRFFVMICFTGIVFANDSKYEKQLIDLRGSWKFEIGDNKNYADPKFSDSKWTEIFVPADWENEGFPGYDGYAWYRKTVTIPSSAQDKKLYLHLGNIDDVCAIYLNGTLIGAGGKFPPDFETAYNREQKFPLPKKMINYDQQNVIAVRVYDDHLNGGIVKGRIGIYEHIDELPLLVSFPGQWKFKTGDKDEWKLPSFNDSKWEELLVPAEWDFQGYRDYDGFAWYRVTFDVPDKLPSEGLVLMLGRIDDFDEAYVNGEKIGSTGRIRSDGTVSRVRNEYREFRGYPIEASSLRPGRNNVLAVRVYDNEYTGGIYEGPVGITTANEFRKWDRKTGNERNSKNVFDSFFEKMFDK